LLETASQSTDTDLGPYLNAVLSKKAQDVILLDVKDLTSVADFFIICSGRSNRQVSALGEHVRSALKDMGIYPLSDDGLKEGHWVLLDYGHIIIHIFYDAIRRFYDLEGLWADARRIKTPAMTAWENAMASEQGPEPADDYAPSEADDDGYDNEDFD